MQVTAYSVRSCVACFRQQLTPGVAMTSHVKRWSPPGSGHHDVLCPRCIGGGGASTIRRLIRRLSVGWRPPDGHPSGACRCRGSSVLYEPLHAAEGDTTPGLRLLRCPLATRLRSSLSRELSGPEGGTGTCWAIAPRHPASSRAMATVTTWACWPRARSGRSRVHSRTGAFHLTACMRLGWFSSRTGKGRLPVAGSREAQAPSTKVRRACGWPALGLDPGRRRSPLAYAEGMRPRDCLS
jgi:hypothetical protein